MKDDPTIHAGMRLFDGASHDAVVERVAYGGFGVIAFGPNSFDHNVTVAYKTLRRELLADRAAYAGFLRECLLWIGMWPHPNIATVYGVVNMGDERGMRPFIALYYAERGSLRDLLRAAAQRERGGRLPLDIALHLAQQIAAGLVYLHTPDPAYLRNEPTVHRDLKPENVLLMGDGRAVITDFGLAKIIEDAAPETRVTLAALLAGAQAPNVPLDTETATQTTNLTADGTAMGTVAYMPPEQWRNARNAGPAADIYAFGVMLSELLAGRHALLDWQSPHTRAEWEQAHAQPAPRLLRTVNDQIPITVETLYLRCLAADPSARPTAAEALATLQAGARAAGLGVYEPGELAEHTTYNEFTQWHNWSVGCFSLTRYEDALERSDRALALARQLKREQPEMLGDALNTRGNILVGLGKQALDRGDQAAAAQWDAQAEAAYREAMDTYPPETTEEGRFGRAYLWHQLGVFHRQRRRWAQSEAAYARALALKPDMPDTYYNRANNLLSWGIEDTRANRREEAIAHLRQARVYAVTSMGMGDPTARMLLGLIGEALGKLGVQ